MSLAGLKKQFNKANQYVSERVGAAEATKLDDTYHDLEKKIDVTNELVEDLLVKTREYLQPNPATRAKMATAATLSKLRGSSKNMPYPQPEGILGDSMLKYGRGMGDDSNFGKALCEAGETYKMMADVKYALEDNVKQNFLDPLTHLQGNDLKEVAHHRKKLQGRRLDYDCKKRKQQGATYDEELRQAEEKLEESKNLAETAMFNVLDNDVEQVSQLCAFVEAQLDFHRQTTQLLEVLADKLKSNYRVSDATSRTRKHHIPKPVLNERQRDRSPGSRSPVPESPHSEFGGGLSGQKKSPSHNASADPWDSLHNSGGAQNSWAPSAAQAPPSYNAVGKTASAPMAQQQQRQACCKALYDFEAENEGELSFKEGQIINLISQIDDNWYEGTLPNGRAGYFPTSYVTIVVPLR